MNRMDYWQQQMDQLNLVNCLKCKSTISAKRLEDHIKHDCDRISNNSEGVRNDRKV